MVGGARSARQFLAEQSNHTAEKMVHVRKMCDLVDRFWKVLAGSNGLGEFGELMQEGWMCKKQLAENVSTSRIDECYEQVRTAGAIGGKLLGAGIGGFCSCSAGLPSSLGSGRPFTICARSASALSRRAARLSTSAAGVLSHKFVHKVAAPC